MSLLVALTTTVFSKADVATPTGDILSMVLSLVKIGRAHV